MQGVVREFHDDRGWGFIVAPGHPDFFFHKNQLVGSGRVQAGDRVAFKPELASKGWRALDVRRLAAEA